jgi:transposase
MIQITPQMRVLVAVEAADFRSGIDGLAQRCRARLNVEPFTGTVLCFRNRRRTAIKLLVYDGQGFWLGYKRLSRERFRWWPRSTSVIGCAATCAARCSPRPRRRTSAPRNTTRPPRA